MRRPSRVCSHVAAEAVDLGGQRGEPVGLVAAQVPDAAQAAGGAARAAHGGDDGGQLADVAQVDVDAR